ncbi:sugar ABC transporter substrate-binding protein [Lachnospiraceae bacterium 62-35]
MKRNMIIALVCLTMALSLCACSGSKSSSAADTAPAESAEKNTTENSGRNVTFVLKNLINPFCVTVKEGAEQAGKDNNLNLTILTPVQGDNNEELMQLVEQAVASGECDTLVVFPSDSIGIVPAVQKAYDAGIPVVILNTAITSQDVIWESFVACENWEVGKACGEALAKKMDYKGKVILIEGVTGAQNSIDRIGGAREAIESYPDMEVAASQSGDMNRAKAMEVMQNLLQAHPDVQGVFAINDEMALGCVEAIAAAGKSDQIIVGGCDGNADARTAIREGKLAFSCDLVPYDQGYQAIAAAAKIVDKEPLEERIVTKMLILDLDNVDETVK